MKGRDPSRLARGHPYGTGTRKVVILLDDETFAEVRDRAADRRCSFAAAARMLIEVGIETLKADGQ